jgi:uncharacterized protein YbjT (DUF2867 family)
MHILLTGSTGFIGAQLARRLLADGHRLRLAVRRPGPAREGVDYVQADFTEHLTSAAWQPALLGIDLVINAVGIFRETGRQTFGRVHVRAPAALFEACSQAGVARVFNLSALGADAGATTPYHRSKKQADDLLVALLPGAVVLQPSLVFGSAGASSRQLLSAASMPLIVGLGGQALVQPIHVDDLVDAVAALVARNAMPTELADRRLPLVGPHALPLAAYLQALREALGLPAAPVLPLPHGAAVLAATVGGWLPGSLFNRDALRMLERGNSASCAPVTQLLGHAPRPPQRFLDAAPVALLRRQAQLEWLLVLMRLALAVVWFAAAMTSFGLYPRADSYAMLAHLGITGCLAVFSLFGAATFDLSLGIATLLCPLRWRRRLWQVQIALIAFYTVAIAWALPEYLLHPFGPIVKNLPFLVALAMLIVLDDGAAPAGRDASPASTAPAIPASKVDAP